jgi:hypothetical protein
MGNYQKTSTIFLLLLISSCNSVHDEQCGTKFCLAGNDFGKLQKNPPDQDFDFYKTTFKGVPIGIYEGNYPDLPRVTKKIKGKNGALWDYGCAKDFCSIWPTDTDVTFVVSAPFVRSSLLAQIALQIDMI